MKKIIKISVDIIMTILLFLLTAYHWTGDTIHEYLGFSLFFFFILHHILNFNWYKSLFKGKYSFNRILNTFINTMLIICMLGLMVSGIMFSRKVLFFLNLDGGGMFNRRLHMLSASWIFVFISAHIGMHWGMFIGMMKLKKIKTIILRILINILGISIAIYGIFSFIKRRLYEKMFLLIDYAFFDYDEPIIFFFLDYLAIMGLFIFITYYFSNYSNKGFSLNK